MQATGDSGSLTGPYADREVVDRKTRSGSALEAVLAEAHVAFTRRKGTRFSTKGCGRLPYQPRETVFGSKLEQLNSESKFADALLEDSETSADGSGAVSFCLLRA